MASLIFLSSLLLTAALSASSSAAAVAAGHKKEMFGGWEPIKNLSDPHVQEIARFAVDEHNKHAENRVKLISVVRGESQVVSGVNYRLVIAASSGGVSGEYEVIVWEKSWVHFRELTSFKQIKP